MGIKRKHLPDGNKVDAKKKTKQIKDSNVETTLIKNKSKPIEQQEETKPIKSIKKPSEIQKNFNKKPGKFGFKSKDSKFGSKIKDGKILKKPDEKVDWKDFKKEKKNLLIQRKSKKPNFPVTTQMKQLYEVLKRKTIKPDEKDETVRKLCNILKSNIQSFVMAHDTARIVQMILKKGNSETKKEISELLIPIISEMATSKYAHHCVLKIFKYGDKEIRNKSIQSLFGSIAKLTLNNIAHHIIDVIYTTYANDMQKNLMKQELYGEMFKKNKDTNIKNLSDVYKDSPEIKVGVLNAVKSILEQISNKNVIDNSLVHVVLYEYLSVCEQTDIETIINLYTSKIPLLVTTNYGCKSAIILFWKAQTRDRRAMVKSIKDYIIKIATHEYGYIFIIAVINSMDDTKTIKKNIFDLLLININDIIKNRWGQKIIEWFVAPACKDNFHPKLIEYFDNGLQYGKKPADIRRKEILESIEESLTNIITSNPSLWISNGHIGLVTATILMKFSSKYFNLIAESIAKIITQTDWICDSNTCENNEQGKNASKIKKENDTNTITPGIEDAGLHVVLKKILKHDEERKTANEKTFGDFIVENLSPETIKFWSTINRACFILLLVLEHSTNETTETLTSLLSKFKKEFSNQNHAGAKLLLKKLNTLKK